MSRDIVRRWRTRRPLTLFALCMTFGVMIGYQNAVSWWLWACGLAIVFAAGCISRRAVFIFSGAMLWGALAVSLSLVRPAVVAADGVYLTGTLSDEACNYDDYIRFPLEDVCANGERLPAKVMVYLYGEEFPSLEYGALVSLKADLYLPSGKNTSTGFDYSAYLWREGVALCASASARDLVVSASSDFSLKALSLRCRSAIQSMIVRIYPEETAPLVSALLLGNRSMLPDDLIDQFNTAGVAHLLAISGLHVGCLAFALERLFKSLRCPDKVSFALLTFLLVVYAWIVGYPPSVVRAVLMYALSSAAKLFGRPSDRLTGLSASLIVLLTINPLLIADPSLILSFSSVGSLLLLSPLFQIKRLPERPRWLHRALFWLFSSLAGSLAIQLGTLPAVANIYGKLPAYSILSNLPIIPLITVALPAAMFSLPLSLLFPLAGRLLAGFVSFCLSALVSFSGWTSALPGATILSPNWPVLLIVLYVLLCAVSASVSSARRWVKYISVALLPSLVGLALLIPSTLPDTDMEITFLDVGQADAAVLRAENQYYLIDVGKNETMADYLSGAGIRPNGIFLSHPHEDHAGGLAEIIDLFPAGVIYISCLWDSVDADDGIPEILDDAMESGWTIRTLQAGDRIELSDNVYADVYQPWPDMTNDGNGSSLVLHVVLGDGSALFTGDLPSEDELAFFPDCDVLKTAHHGSANSTSRLFLQMTTPSVAIISVGHNAYGHPSLQTLERLSDIPTYRTDECGTISTLIRPDGSTTVTFTKISIESEAAS